jgi:hypothetical protein
MVKGIEDLFPRLRDADYRVIGPPDATYNCIAWAAGVTDAWWWPSGDPAAVYWPPGAPREETLDAVIAAFASIGFESCQDADVEVGFEKIALFAGASQAPTHAARQLATGRWTSKLGQLECIEHDLPDLEGAEYGTVAAILKRPRGR